VIQSNVGTAVFATSSTLAFGSNTTTGNAIVAIFISTGNVVEVSVTDLANGTYALDHAETTKCITVWSKLNITGATTPTITFNLNAGGDSGVMIIVEISGLKTSSAFDKSVDNSQFTTNTYTSTATATLSQAVEILIGIHVDRANLNTTFTPTNSFQLIRSGNTPSGNPGTGEAQYLVVASTTPVASTGGVSVASTTIVSTEVTYEGAPAGGPNYIVLEESGLVGLNVGKQTSNVDVF